MIYTKAKKTREEQTFEKQHALISRACATEGIVLLKNEGVLPISGKKVALFGAGAVKTLKGGIGSGEVNCRYNVSIMEGFENAGLEITTKQWLVEYLAAFEEKKKEYVDFMRKKSGLFHFSVLKYLLEHPFNNPEDMLLVDRYLEDADVCFYVISRQAGENVDRMPKKGDFLLSDREVENITICANRYKNMVLVINAGGFVDLSVLDNLNIGGIIFFCQQGQEGGNALGQLVIGKESFSGHLASSWPEKYEDIPFGKEFSILNGNTKYEEYREGIYMGYRYFDSFSVEPRYAFGYGLSYTDFDIQAEVYAENTDIVANMRVKNIGSYAGKEVVQIYASLPKGRLDKEYQRLVGFAKTRILQPQETQELSIRFAAEGLKSYDENLQSFLLEKGEYVIRIGNSSRNTTAVGKLVLREEHIISRHCEVAPERKKIEVLRAEYREENTADIPTIYISESGIQTKTFVYKDYEYENSCEVERLLQKLTVSEKISLCIGAGLDIALPGKHYFNVPGAGAYTTSKLWNKKIPDIPFCDGPVGLRLFDECVQWRNTVRMTKPVMASFDFLPAIARRFMIYKPKEGKMLYQYATAFPVGMAMGQTWNVDLMKEFGLAVQKEMKAFGVEFWLAPGINLHRNPLCGRNYEYFSEDPLLSGKMAAAICSAVQSKPNFSTTVKHFCCNNQEIDRRTISENVSQRALRELYLRNFEIAVLEGKPNGVMTAYNKVNGTYCAENYDLINKVLRNEWGYEGLVMTDWTTENGMLDSTKAMKAGVNLMMPGIASDHKQMKKMAKDKSFVKYLNRSAGHVLTAILRTNLYREMKGEKNAD